MKIVGTRFDATDIVSSLVLIFVDDWF